MADEARVTQHAVVSVESDPSAMARVTQQSLVVVRELLTTAMLTQQCMIIVRDYSPGAELAIRRSFVPVIIGG